MWCKGTAAEPSPTNRKAGARCGRGAPSTRRANTIPVVALTLLAVVAVAVVPPLQTVAAASGASGHRTPPSQPTPPPSFNCGSYGQSLDVFSPNPAAGIAGTRFTLQGSGYYNAPSPGNFTIWMASYTGGDLLYFTKVTAAEYEREWLKDQPFWVNVTVPGEESGSSLPPGAYEFWSVNDSTTDTGCANYPFTLTATPPAALGCVSWNATLTLLSPIPATGGPETPVVLNGSGFSETGATGIYWANTTGSAYQLVGSAGAEPPGDFFELTVDAPSGYAAGTYVFWGVDEDSDCAGVVFVLTAAPALTLSATSGPPGSVVTGMGTGFASDSTVTFTFDGAPAPSDCATNSTGDFPGTTGLPCTFTVPPVAYGDDGGDNVAATDASSHSASASFTVLPEITLTPNMGPMGGEFTVTGIGFSPSPDTATITFDGNLIDPITDLPACDNETSLIDLNATGGFTCTFTVPPFATFGANEVQGMDTSSGALTAAVTFTVPPELSITSSPTVGPIGTPVTATGAGWTPGDSIALWVAPVSDESQITVLNCVGAPSGEPTVASTGGFTCDFDFPSVAPGAYTVAASDASHVTYPPTVIYSGNTFYLVGPLITVNPSAGPIGSTFTVTGTGFEPFPSTAIVSFDGQQITPTGGSDCSFNDVLITLNTTGGFVCTFSVPESAALGAHEVRGDDTGTGLLTPEQTFMVTLSFATLSLSPDQGPVGTVVYLAGSGYASLALFDYCFEGSGAPAACGSTREFLTTPGGDIPSGTAIQVPSGENAQVVVSALTTGTLEASAAFALTIPYVETVSSTTGTSGSATFTVSGLADSTAYYVYLDTVQGVASVTSYNPLGTCTSSATGVLTACTVPIPHGLSAGTYYVDLFQDPSPPPFIFSVFNFTIAPASSAGNHFFLFGLTTLELLIIGLAVILIAVLAVGITIARRPKPAPRPPARTTGTAPKSPPKSSS